MRNLIYFSVFLLICSNIAKAETYQNNVPAKVMHYIASLEEQKPNLQGGVVAILHKGAVVYKTSFGNMKGNSKPIKFSTLMPLASVSKTVTSTAIALMVDKKKLDLDKKYSLPYLKSKVSLRNILGNTTGYRINGNQDIEAGMPRQKILNKLKTLPQHCLPGKCYFYSNLCFSLASEVLDKEKMSLKYAIDQLKKTLKTEEIFLTTVPPDVDVAYPHIKNKKSAGFTQLPFPQYYPSAVPASAGIFASLDAMIELFKLEFFYRPDLISNDTLKIFYEPYINAYVYHWNLTFPVESYYGISWRIFKSPDNKDKNLIFHSGFMAGINTFVGFIPSEELGIIVLLNEAPPTASRLGLNFWRESF